MRLPRSPAICILLLLVFASTGRAVDPSPQLSQHAHSAWRIQDGVFRDAPKILAQTADGYLWIGTISGLMRFDGVRFVPWTPPVHIEGIIADRNNYLPGNGLHLPPLSRNLEINYTVLSFVAPQKVRFRYKLEGRDSNWQEAGTRRQAFYNDLRPGEYRFRVMACNNEDIWNEGVPTLAFSVRPAWHQTNWFLIICVVCGFLILWAVYRFRVRQIARVMSVRFDERLAERTRLARDLHDTLLQTVQGSKMFADHALEQADDPATLRRAIEKLSEWLGQATQEGRASLDALRSSTTQTNDLAEALRRAAEDCQTRGDMEVNFSLAGNARDLHPIVRDEIYRIGYEAIRNACVHSGAGLLEIELRYEQDLALRISDNGAGIDMDVAERGRPGHFGLQGMRERAARVGGKFILVNSPASGTEISVVVPGSMAYQKARAPRFERIRAVVFGR